MAPSIRVLSHEARACCAALPSPPSPPPPFPPPLSCRPHPPPCCRPTAATDLRYPCAERAFARGNRRGLPLSPAATLGRACARLPARDKLLFPVLTPTEASGACSTDRGSCMRRSRPRSFSPSPPSLLTCLHPAQDTLQLHTRMTNFKTHRAQPNPLPQCPYSQVPPAPVHRPAAIATVLPTAYGPRPPRPSQLGHRPP